MAGPPPYGPKKSNTTTIIFIVLGVCAVCCILGAVGIVGTGFFAIKKSKNLIACAIGFEEVAKAMKVYAEEHDGKLPKKENWQTELRPYFIKQLEKDEEGAKMFGSFDPDGEWVCKDDSGGSQQTGVAFNSALSGKKLSDIPNKRTTYILFEVPKTGMNLHDEYVELPEAQSPKIFGQPRGWFHVDANFSVEGTTNDSQIRFN